MSAVLQRKRYTEVIKLAFPDIGLDDNKFATIQRQLVIYIFTFHILVLSILPDGHWADMANRKAFFDNIAHTSKFDPLVAENWYSLSHDKMSDAEVFIAIMLFAQVNNLLQGYNVISRAYNDNLISALMHVYPDIGLDPSKFPFSPKSKCFFVCIFVL